MEENKPAKLLHIVDDLKAEAVDDNLYEDVKNSKEQRFIGLDSASAKELVNNYHLDPMLNQTYVYDISSQSYILLDDEVEKHLSENRLEAYVTIFGYMGATSVEGEIVELTKKVKEKDKEGGITYKAVDVSAVEKKAMREDFSKTIYIKRNFGEKNIKSYEEIREYLIIRDLMNDVKLRNRLEELRYSSNQQLKGTYENRVTLTHNLESTWKLGAKVSATPIFKANVELQERCKHYTEVYFELKVSFD